VRQRAGNHCEYCGLSQADLPLVTFHVEHVISRQHNGTDDESSLCLACHWCNFHKGPNIASLEGGELVPLFDPRSQVWSENFERRGDLIVGLTPVGCATVRVLNMNDAERRELRRTM
jgi:hypothetical protein